MERGFIYNVFLKKMRLAVLAALLTIVIIVFSSCNGHYMVERYADIDIDSQAKVIEVINDYYGIEAGRITKISKVLYQWARDAELYIFAEVDWPELWSDYSWRNDVSSEAYSLLGTKKDKDLGSTSDNFTYDIETQYISENKISLAIMRQMDDNHVVFRMNTQIWQYIKNALESKTQ